MITVEFIWDEGDSSVGLWAGWETCYALIEQGEGIRTLVSFEPVSHVPVHLWRIDQIETQYYWSEPCAYCGGTGDRPYQGGERKGELMGRCHPCKSTGVVEKFSTLCINEFADETEQMMRRLYEIAPVALAVKREWDRITLLDEIRRHEEDASLAFECQEAEAARDKYSDARNRYESIYGDLEETTR